MPRKGRGAKAPKDTNFDEAIQAFWQRRIRAGLKAREEYDKIARDVAGYFRADHKGSFEGDQIERFMDFEGVAAVSVPKVAQARNSLGPHLYPTNTQRTVTAKTDDGVMVGFARCLQEYLNYTPEESGYDDEAREGVDDSLLSGRGVLGVTFNETLGIVCSKRIKSTNLVIDPDADSLKNAEWIAVRDFVPLFRLKREAEKKNEWRLKGLERDSSPVIKSTSRIDADYADKPAEPEYGATNRIVEVYTVYSKMGAGIRGLDFGEGHGTPNDNEDWVQLGVVLDHHVPIYQGEWDVPLYLDDAWPVTVLDLVQTPDELWPVSLMGQVLGLQRALDILTTIRLSSCKQHGRTIVLGDSSMSSTNQELIRNGPETVFIPVELAAGERLPEKIHVLPMGSMSAELGRERDYLEREMGETTGVTPTVTGVSSQGSQDRSATASQIRSQATSVRLSDMKGRVEKWSGKQARHEAIYVRLELDAEEVSRYVRTSKINMLYVRIEVAGAVVPLRDMRTRQELATDADADADADRGALTVMDLDPMAATFFDAGEEGEQEATQALLGLWEQISGSTDERIIELVDSLGPGQQGPNGESFPPEGITLAPVTCEDVWRETSDLTSQDLMREFSYKLATGSMAITDSARLQDQYDILLQQFLPVAHSAQDYNAVNAILQGWQDANDVPEDKRIPPLQPPAPPPMQGGPPPEEQA